VLRGMGLVGVGLGLVGPANDPAVQVGWVVIFAFYFVVWGGWLGASSRCGSIGPGLPV